MLDLDTSPTPRWSDLRKARIWPSFVSADGKVTRAAKPLPMLGAAVPGVSLGLTEVGPIVDWDEDGSLDLLLTLDGMDFTDPVGTRIRRHLDFRLRAGRVESITVPAFISSRGTDVDHDGRLDHSFSIRVQVRPCGKEGLPPPRPNQIWMVLLAHAVGRGAFRVDDEEARRWYRHHSCPHDDDEPLINLREGSTERRIRCERLLGRSPAAISERLRKEHAKLSPHLREDPQCAPLDAWLKVATWRPEQALTTVSVWSPR